MKRYLLSFMLAGSLAAPALAQVVTVQNGTGLTAGQIPKAQTNSTGLTNPSALTDNGTAILSTETVQVNLNLGSLPTAQGGNVFQGSAAAGTNPRVELDGFAAFPTVSLLTGGGTVASPTAVAASTTIGTLGFGGYDGTSWIAPTAQVLSATTENWSNTAHGTYIGFTTTTTGTTTLSEKMRIASDGGIMLPPTVTGSTQGFGTINANGLYRSGSAVVAQADIPSCTDTSGNHLNFGSGTFTCGTSSSGGGGGSTVLRNYIAGFQFVNDTTSTAIDIGAGQASDSTNVSTLSFGFGSVATTCGSVANGATSCTVASATGILPGAQITIAGAGNSGGTTPLTTYVTAVSGTTVTWKGAAVNTSTITGAAVAGTGSCVGDLSLSGQAGGLDTGSASGTAFYGLFIINGASGTSCIASKEVAATVPVPTLPTGYTKYRYVGTMRAVGTAWTTFANVGDIYWYSTTISDVANATQSTTGVLYTLSVPLGIKVRPIVRYQLDGSHSGFMSAPDESDQASDGSGGWSTTPPGFDVSAAATVGFPAFVTTNTSGQVRARLNGGTATFFNIMTRGWVDTKGRES